LWLVATILVALLGISALFGVFYFWWDTLVAIKHGKAHTVTASTVGLLLVLKAPIVLAWVWLLRITSRQHAASTHRAALARNKRAALLTYELLLDRHQGEQSGRDQMLTTLAGLVFDPTGTGITDDHRDGISFGPQQISVGK
jgi:hypothetical protein